MIKATVVLEVAERALILAAIAVGLGSQAAVAGKAAEPPTISAPVGPVTPSPVDYSYRVFSDAVIHFTPDDPGRYDTEETIHEDDGRVAIRTLDLAEWEGTMRAIAVVSIRPIPRDELSVHDGWDRAGNVRICPPGMAEIELVRFITAYGGPTDHEVDVTRFAPLLMHRCTFKAFVDTWSSPGWLVDLIIRLERPDDKAQGRTDEAPWTDEPAWHLGVLYNEGVTEETMRGGPIEVEVEVPQDAGRVMMYYLSTGHCTDGSGADEFLSKDNVISVDGVAVHRYRPWRDDCGRFRSINPYTRRWSDGTWSSDYSRSGWCPGDLVEPLALDLTDHLTPGRHLIGFSIEGVRPEDAEGHFGYWRVSSNLVGWRE
ncbi:MAG: hypothetical protein JXB46_09285 [Candidatus Eisenbacteria bacterium]|nr:hypothetical protein [Candidatus Eisenbacteria bacterium]